MQRQIGFQVIHNVNGEIKVDFVKSITFIDPVTIDVTIEGDVKIRVDTFNNMLQEFTSQFDVGGRGLLTGDIVMYKEQYYSVAFIDGSVNLVSEVRQENILLTTPIAMMCQKVGNVVQNGELIAPPKKEVQEVLEKNEGQINS